MSANADASTAEKGRAVPLQASEAAAGGVSASLDFAHWVEGRLLLYGWVLGFATQVESALLSVGSLELDLKALASPVARPDVSRHFALEEDGHGFFALIGLPHSPAGADLLLTITLRSGETQESRWTLQRHTEFTGLPPAHLTTLRTALPALPPVEKLRLACLLQDDSLPPGAGLPTPREPLRLEVDSCCVLDRRILLVCGWLLDPAGELESVQLTLGSETLDLLAARVPIPRPDIDPESADLPSHRAHHHPGFFLVQVVEPVTFDQDEAIFALRTAGGETAWMSRPAAWNPREARRQLAALLDGMDLESAMRLLQRLLAATHVLPGMQSLREWLEARHDRLVQRLSPSVQQRNQRARYWLHIDQCLPVADKGVFLGGWCHTENTSHLDVVYHCGELRFPLSANWARHTRADVTAYLQGEGSQAPDHEHGFLCYVPLRPGSRPAWLSATTEDGDEWRMVLPAGQASSTMQTVRGILAAFPGEHRDLRTLMDRHVGPAVEAAWAARPRLGARAMPEQFGPRRAEPAVSIVVPLYGRWDFVEYQLSQFANDPDFQNVELIYVVDDPAIYDPFRQAAPLLWGVYQIPFLLAFPGSNLGFAGANNFGAGYARSSRLLLLNSDVLPKQPGWLSELLRIHATLETPGLLGARLLYEDGTLQHAGIAFRRYAPWGGMWINNHPHKGQMLSNLHGTREEDAVTAACMLVETAFYRELGGFGEEYIIGDFEDSDLCLRAREAGRKNYVALDVELYHLERQSQNRTGDAVWRQLLTAYNCWLHDRRWSRLISRITGELS